MLELSSPDHGGQNPLDGLLGIFLLSEVLHDGVVRHLAADCEPLLQLLLNFVLEVLIFLGGETFSSRQVPRLSCGQSRDLKNIELTRQNSEQFSYLEDPDGFIHMGVGGEWFELHLGETLADPHHGLQLSDSDGDGEPLVSLLLQLLVGVPHQNIFVLKLLRCPLLQSWPTARSEILRMTRSSLEC